MVRSGWAKAAWIYVTLITILMTGSVSADCSDPGTPGNGYRNITRKGRGFPVRTVISFSCNPHYTLSGAKKIICNKNKNIHSWNGKLPSCQLQSPSGCPLPPPTVSNAIITDKVIDNRLGSKVRYACIPGYTTEPADPYMLCDKDSTTQGYKWSGNFTCKKRACGHPSPQSIEHGNYSLSVLGSSTIATYYCLPTYILKVKTSPKHVCLVHNYTKSCDQSGYWPDVTLTCVKTCSSVIAPRHGKINYSRPRECDIHRSLSSIVYTQGVQILFTCDTRYSLVGSSSRTCLPTGLWSNQEPHCVLSTCANPDRISNGHGTFNSTSNGNSRPIWTTVTYSCNTGYQLKGVEMRQCLPNGQWSGQSNPICQKSYITCKPPRNIANGQYTPFLPIYLLNVRVHYTCAGGCFLWGAHSLRCTAVPGETKGEWLPTCDDLCHGKVNAESPECLPLDVFEEKCNNNSGRVIFRNRSPFCQKSSGTDAVPTANLISIKTHDNELDKMTIVVATAGSTLGALVVLLTALVCFRRFHQSRRFRYSAFRSRRHSDDDRIAIIAAYTGDVHFILPSYDEAMSQVQSSPPPFESVIANGQEGENQTASNSNSQNNDERNIAAETTDGTPEAGPSAAEERPINIVNNPLADSPYGGSEIIDNSDNVLPPVDENKVDVDSSPNRRADSLSSSSSEDDLTSSQTRPLLGNSERGVMV